VVDQHQGLLWRGGDRGERGQLGDQGGDHDGFRLRLRLGGHLHDRQADGQLTVGDHLERAVQGHRADLDGPESPDVGQGLHDFHDVFSDQLGFEGNLVDGAVCLTAQLTCFEIRQDGGGVLPVDFRVDDVHGAVDLDASAPATHFDVQLRVLDELAQECLNQVHAQALPEDRLALELTG